MQRCPCYNNIKGFEKNFFASKNPIAYALCWCGRGVFVEMTIPGVDNIFDQSIGSIDLSACSVPNHRVVLQRMAVLNDKHFVFENSQAFPCYLENKFDDLITN